MIRLDKYLSELNIGSRSQIKDYIRQGTVAVNGITVLCPEQKIDENTDSVSYRGKECSYKKYVYFMLNKPSGVVSATEDNTCVTVTDLLKDTGYKNLFPVGRLDKDTEGFLLMTNDGELAHNLLSPRKHVGKTYYVELTKSLSDEDIQMLEEGVDIGEEKKTLPAKVKRKEEDKIFLTITEGKFHQVKRMMKAVNNEVIYLKRVAMGGLFLDESLLPGQYRELKEEELTNLLY